MFGSVDESGVGREEVNRAKWKMMVVRYVVVWMVLLMMVRGTSLFFGEGGGR